MSITIEIDCPACGGTGLYRGFAEPEGVAVVCLECRGTGAKEFSYSPFHGRRLRTDVRYVRRSRGSLVALGVGPTGDTISYDDFRHGKMP